MCSFWRVTWCTCCCRESPNSELTVSTSFSLEEGPENTHERSRDPEAVQEEANTACISCLHQEGRSCTTSQCPHSRVGRAEPLPLLTNLLTHPFSSILPRCLHQNVPPVPIPSSMHRQEYFIWKQHVPDPEDLSTSACLTSDPGPQ